MRDARDAGQSVFKDDEASTGKGEDFGSGKTLARLPLPPTSNPYAMPAALQSPKKLAGEVVRSAVLSSTHGSPVPSVRSCKSPLA